MRDNDDDPTTHFSTDPNDDEWPEPPDPFRGVLDVDPWAANGRDPRTGRTIHPLGPAHVCRQLPDGSYELRPQIAHRLAWWLSGMRLRAGFTQTDLAERLKTTQPAIAKWETGRTLITLDRLAQFSDATGFPVALYFDYGGSQRHRGMWL
ncbi:MAG TPA: helix-turn-helix transcriptional regulator [Candidatus Nanopelagicales bacterium]|nr:helix-turn-helix transcriptional regulator [Candidatus Nanopelagicales bacterium]